MFGLLSQSISLQIFGPFNVHENQSPGKTIGRVSAADKDIGSNAVLMYGISREYGRPITVMWTLILTASILQEMYA
jgi:hypothetical protein